MTEGKAEPAAARSLEFDVYVVRAGDTLSRIARRYRTTVQALRDSNKLSADRIAVGQKLRVPVPPAPRAATAV